MKHFFVVTLAAAGLLSLTGCLNCPSLYPLYSPEAATFDPALTGLWRTGEKDYLIVEPTQKGPSPAYRVIAISGSDAMRFDAWLVQIGTLRVVDLLPEESGGNIPGHSFARIQLLGDKLRVSFFDSDSFRKKATDAKVAMPVSGDATVLVAPTADLQRFLARFAAESTDSDWEVTEYTRVR